MRFASRIEAGKKLAEALKKYAGNPNVVVIGLPRGGVPVAYEVADALALPLDIIIIRKIGAPYNPELAVGALAENGTVFFNQQIMQMLGLSTENLQPIIKQEMAEAERRKQKYLGDRTRVALKDKIVILVDDGIATGATIRSAIQLLRAEGVQKIIVAVPVAPRDMLATLQQEAEEVICLYAPDIFPGVGAFYDSFAQTTDEEVIDLLSLAKIH